jgi:hypothetical protein
VLAWYQDQETGRTKRTMGSDRTGDRGSVAAAWIEALLICVAIIASYLASETDR